jgi:hypothetical protein
VDKWIIEIGIQDEYPWLPVSKTWFCNQLIIAVPLGTKKTEPMEPTTLELCLQAVKNYGLYVRPPLAMDLRIRNTETEVVLPADLL